METLFSNLFRDYHTISYLISNFIFWGYIILITALFGWLPSISDSYYAWEKKKRFMGVFFTLFCWSFPIALFVATEHGLIFGAAAGLAFVGAACQFLDDELTRKVHFTGAYFSVLMSQLFLVFNYHMYWLSAITIVLLIIVSCMKINNKTFWLEIIAFTSAQLGIGYELFFNQTPICL